MRISRVCCRYAFTFDSRRDKQGKADNCSPRVADFDLHAPRALAAAGLGKVSEDRDPYSDYWGGGIASDGAFGSAKALSDEEIDSMLESFLKAATLQTEL
jgi:hypothetical protein